MRRLLWRALALLGLLLGLAGIVLPVLPTVPFLLLAAWAAGKGWPRLEARLLNHPRLGSVIRRWRDRGAVPRRAKWAASLMMLASAAMLALTSLSPAVKISVAALMLVVAIWLWRRPD